MHSAHANIPVFIPHLGCPNMCTFCNQKTISGTVDFDVSKVNDLIDLSSEHAGKKRDKEIAFFGGSFTGIERDLMIRLLDIAQKRINEGKFSGIRMSTRPDYISEEILDILSHYTISAIELGIQSFSDAVLKKCKRGHTSDISVKAMKLINEYGFKSVGQMMIGLPGATNEDEIDCAKKICELGASGSRIYPTLVLKNTELHEQTVKGEYIPLSLEEAIQRSANVLSVFIENNVECLRIGLCESENLHSDDTFYAGPNHPALGELVYGEIYYRAIKNTLSQSEFDNSHIRIIVPSGAVSKAVGHKRCNINRLKEEYEIKKIEIEEDIKLTPYSIRIE